MNHDQPITELPTHRVHNQPPPLEEYNLFEEDPVLQSAVAREGANWAGELLSEFGRRLGTREVLEWGDQANRFPPCLKAFDRFGQRVDEVEYHPSYHRLLELGISHGVHRIAWDPERPGGHVAHAALLYLLSQVEAGVCCPLAMTHSVVPALQPHRELFSQWSPRLFSGRYDSRFRPPSQKQGVTFGMAMTEKQGGSDVRANSTRARKCDREGVYLLEGHKWFCSAPMSDAFLTLAQADGGLTCFLVPRWKPDGTRNRFFIQRLKDKLGNRSNASAEIEYAETWAVRVGEEGAGVRAIIPMVHHTRLDAAVAAASLMRQAFVQAAHHATHRCAFGKALVAHPLMQNVLADLALESEAATALAIRVAGLFETSQRRAETDVLGRLMTAAAKFWLNKRAPLHVAEALECLGGSGYVEESMLPRLYREAPLNGIWEGSGNVICLDVLRSLRTQPEAGEVLLSELGGQRGAVCEFDRALDRLKDILARLPSEGSLRTVTEEIARVSQAAVLIRNGPDWVAEAFCRTRLQPSHLGYGALEAELPWKRLIRRNWRPEN